MKQAFAWAPSAIMAQQNKLLYMIKYASKQYSNAICERGEIEQTANCQTHNQHLSPVRTDQLQRRASPYCDKRPGAWLNDTVELDIILRMLTRKKTKQAFFPSAIRV